MTDEQDRPASPQMIEELQDPNRALSISPKETVVPIIRQQLQIDAVNWQASRQRQTGFNIKSLAINNPTGVWWYCAAIHSVIPPWSFNLVYNIPGGTQSIDFYPETPPGESSSPVANQKLMVTACSIEQQPTSGIVYIRVTP